jgi:hypothetical protein
MYTPTLHREDMKARLEREFAIVAAVDERREAGRDVGTIEQQIIARHLVELEIQEADAAIERIKHQVND